MVSTCPGFVDSALAPIIVPGSHSECSVNVEPDVVEQSIDPDFLTTHLRDAPPYFCSMEFEDSMAQLTEMAAVDASISRPAAKVLTSLSQALFDTLSNKMKGDVRRRYRIPEDKAAHLVFVERHSIPLTHFPKPQSSASARDDSPEIVAVFNPDDTEPSLADPACQGIPWHRVEAIVEVSRHEECQAENYAYLHHLARPDRPMVYCLIAQPEGYQIMLSSPSGVVYSPRMSWAQRRLLAAYIYSHYHPPPLHFLVDETITWNPVPRWLLFPSWTIQFNGKTYTDGMLIFVGDPCGKRTTVLQARDVDGNLVVLKEMYHDASRQWSEVRILEHIHAEGDVPGFVRMRAAEKVVSQGDIIQCGDDEEETLKIKRRLEFLDIGEHPLRARSVNDLLMAFYDVLETHRTLYMERKVLHRDMSVNNIRIYPKWAKIEGRTVLKSAPPLITDVLDGARRPIDDLKADGLVIDVDYAVILRGNSRADLAELKSCTGTPMFIARSVNQQEVLRDYYVIRNPMRMPTLRGEALRLYTQVHGEERYIRYNEKGKNTYHGGIPPKYITENPPEFIHRPEHDVESIFWSLVTTLLRVRPMNSTPEKVAPESVARIWTHLRPQTITGASMLSGDERCLILEKDSRHWESRFLPQMRDVAQLISQISDHVSSEYALWGGDLIPDHLHEAVQRLILQYLVDHRDKDIILDPDRLRPTKRPSNYQDVDSEDSTVSDDDDDDEDEDTSDSSEESYLSTSEESYEGSASSDDASSWDDCDTDSMEDSQSD